MDLKQPLKKIIQYSVAGLILMLNIINIYNAWKDNSDLIDTAKSSLKKIESSAIQIGKVESVLGDVKNNIEGQVKLLDSAISKSQELIRLDSLDFESKKAELGITSMGFIIDPDDPSKIQIQTVILNSGRKALIKYSGMIYFSMDENGNNVNFLNEIETKSDNWIQIEVDPKLNINMVTESILKSELEKENARLVIVLSIIYQDYISKKHYKETFYQETFLPYKGKNEPHYQSPKDIKITNQILKKYGHYELIYPSEFY
ncbi:hypothetical protein V1387_12820 [Allomuricauda taeanensis]|uniref:hypothetical protein n=1 Tax=Flagellimonas taeanensis TaxID=1005926 RepID=UPI002E7AF08B|nr:hypothetical protein [Allomuricauda taeanensis]MEE1963573.1 hypothetical protein [Allomuricauda taeanensis]